MKVFEEHVGDLVTERTSQGDSILLLIKNKGSRPELYLKFSTYDPEKQGLRSEENLSNYVPKNPFWFDSEPVFDPATNQYKTQLTSEQKGFNSWQDYLYSPIGVIATIKAIVEAGGRHFDFREIN